MRIAFLLSGQPRINDISISLIKTNFSDKYNIDFFIHTWWDPNMVNISTKMTYDRVYTWKANTIEKITEVFKPRLILQEPQKQFDLLENVVYQQNEPMNVTSGHYSMMMSNELKKFYEQSNNFKYDIVMRARFDTIFHYISKDFDILNLDMTKLHCSSVGPINDLQPNDQFAICSSELMDYYCSLFRKLQTYSEQGLKDFYSGERMLRFHLQKGKIDINYTKDFEADILKKF